MNLDDSFATSSDWYTDDMSDFGEGMDQSSEPTSEDEGINEDDKAETSFTAPR